MKLKRAYRVWQRHVTVYTKLYKSSIALNFIEPVFYLVALGFGLGAFVREINGVPYINYIAPGIVASSTMFAASIECTYGTFVRMTFQKTFDAILATPVGLSDLVAGELLWGATKGMIYGTIIMVVISLFGLVESPMMVFLVPFLFIGALVFAEVAVITAALAPGIDTFNYFYTLFMTPMFLFSGIFFPIESMPPLVAKIAYFTPLYHLVNTSRALSNGLLPPADILWLMAVAALLAPYPFRLMRRRILR